MINTKIMLACILTYILVWLFLGSIVYFLNEQTFKECLKSDVVILLLILIGWIPSLAVGYDLTYNK